MSALHAMTTPALVDFAGEQPAHRDAVVNELRERAARTQSPMDPGARAAAQLARDALAQLEG